MDLIIIILCCMLAALIIAVVFAHIDYKKIKSAILKVLIVFFIIVSIAGSEGPQAENMSCEQHPAVFGMDRMPQAVQTAERWGDWIAAFMENGSWPVLLGNNSSQQMTA
jgi:hypothetical protein